MSDKLISRMLYAIAIIVMISIAYLMITGNTIKSDVIIQAPIIVVP
jgi:hypothetical protein